MHLLPLIFLIIFTNTVTAADTSATHNKSITILTYNVLHHTDTFMDDLKSLVGNTPVPTERIAPTLDLLAHLDPDIIALQEVTPVLLNAIKQHPILKSWQIHSTLPPAKHGWRRYLASAVRYFLDYQPWGQAILSRLPVTQVRSYPLARPVLVADIVIEGLMLTVATCHLDSFAKNQQKRIWQLNQIFHHLELSTNTILLGDFNFGDDTPEDKALTPTYTDIWPKLHPENPGYTLRKRRLDRILIRSLEWGSVGIRLIGNEPITIDGGKHYASDHFGVMATLGHR